MERGQIPMTLEPGMKAELDEVRQELGLANLNDAAATILANHFGLEYEPLGTTPRPLRDSDYVCWSVPLRLRDRIMDKLQSENRARRRRHEPRLNRDEYLNRVFRGYLDARRSVVA